MNNKTNNEYFRILSIEAKDIMDASLYNKNGYSIKDKDGKYNLSKFKSVLDYSLDLIELNNIHSRKKTKIGFVENGFNHTLDLVNVKFNYSLYEFNQHKDFYIKKGYSFEELEFTDCVCFENGNLVAVETNKTCPQTISKQIDKYFTYKNNKYFIKDRSVSMSTLELREKLYNDGFYIDGVHYVRYKRSAGSARLGNCLFIKEELFKAMNKWSLMGLSNEMVNIDPVSFEAYNSLSLSSLEETLILDPKNILILKDVDSKFKEQVISVKGNNRNLVSESIEEEVCNSIFDGEGLLDSSIFDSLKREKGMALLRGRFFKCCAFNTNIAKFFKDNGITEISQLNGYTQAESVDDIKLICTESSIKYLKFDNNISSWVNNVGNLFGIVKFDKPTHYFEGRMVRTNYQMINTLKMSFDEVEKLVKQSKDYLASIRLNPDVLRNHIHFNEYDAIEEDEEDIKDKYEIVYALLGINNKFYNTQLYKNFKSKVCTGFKNRLLNGQLLVKGTYATLFGNGYELLLHSIGKYSDDVEPVLSGSDVMIKSFNNNEELVCARSPHVTMGNLLVSTNRNIKEYNEYFNLTDEIICVNAINNNIQQRLNGCDYDSDTMLVTNNSIILNSAKSNYNSFKVPFCAMKPMTITGKTLASVDYTIQSNKVGEIINYSQYLNSLLWDTLDYSIYEDICKLAVLSGMEIDKAKRVYDVDTKLVLDSLKKKYDKIDNETKLKIRPLFFKTSVIDNKRNKDSLKKICFKKFNTTMDHIKEAIGNDYSTPKLKPFLFTDIIRKPEGLRSGTQSTNAKRVIEIANEAESKLSPLRCSIKDSDEQSKKIIMQDMSKIYTDYVSKLKNELKDEYTVYLILKKLEEFDTQKLAWILMYLLYNDKHKVFTSLMTNEKEEINYLTETQDSEVYKYQLYDFFYI